MDGLLDSSTFGRKILGVVTAQDDIASVAGQLAALTRTVEEMTGQLRALRQTADDQKERADIQQERIDLAARELTEVSDRLQAAANALRESI
jgi:methyl-accepting chemotaxis protein